MTWQGKVAGGQDAVMAFDNSNIYFVSIRIIREAIKINQPILFVKNKDGKSEISRLCETSKKILKSFQNNSEIS